MSRASAQDGQGAALDVRPLAGPRVSGWLHLRGLEANHRALRAVWGEGPRLVHLTARGRRQLGVKPGDLVRLEGGRFDGADMDLGRVARAPAEMVAELDRVGAAFVVREGRQATARVALAVLRASA